MQTHFTAAQLADPKIAESNAIIRKCVHCGFCTATCPTYVLLGDELDSPRGRIYLIKGMLESGAPVTPDVVRHLDRCLSCLSCVTTCPSGVNYMHLIDDARVHVEETFRRPPLDRAIRSMIAAVIPEPRRFRIAAALARLGRPLAVLLHKIPSLAPLAAMLELAPSQFPPVAPEAQPGLHPATGERRHRVGLLAGCVQSVLMPQINAATVRLLNRLGADVVIPPGLGCCGALTHHMGRERDAMNRAATSIDIWLAQNAEGPLDAIVANASGCGTMLKTYDHLLRHDAGKRDGARTVSRLAVDVSELALRLGYRGKAPRRLRVAYQSACSLQHGQKVTREPVALLEAAGFEVVTVPEGHLCCGSAGTYNLVQPAIARRLRDRKIANIASTRPDVIASGNIGCITQIGSGTTIPILHTVELLDWAAGGPVPERLK
ncbi:MAG: glycolate oxidase subunit GlcF [Aestuariivirgaceae bacterium]